jgi:laminin alpha 3/5
MENGTMSKVFVKISLKIPEVDNYIFIRFYLNVAIKAKNVVTLSVDNVFVEPGIGVAGVSSTDTNNPLFIGGHPNPSKPRGIKTQEQFVGCIRNLNINRNLLRFGSTQAIGSVTATTCPTI